MIARAAVSCMVSGMPRRTCSASSSNSLIPAFYHAPSAHELARPDRTLSDFRATRSKPNGRDAQRLGAEHESAAPRSGGRPTQITKQDRPSKRTG
jgi:hypothetical protein